MISKHTHYKQSKQIFPSKSSSPLVHCLNILDDNQDIEHCDKPINQFVERIPSPNGYNDFKNKVLSNYREDLKYCDYLLVYVLDINDNFRSHYFVDYECLNKLDIKNYEYIAVINKTTNNIECYNNMLNFVYKYQKNYEN